MSTMFSENGTALTETIEDVTMPVDFTFEKVNDFVHSTETHFEELQALCLGMSSEFERIAFEIRYPDFWDTMEYPTLLDAIKEIGMVCIVQP